MMMQLVRLPAISLRKSHGQIRAAGLFALVLMLANLIGCANDQQRTRAEGSGIGAVVGAVIGGAIGGRDGAAIGAFVGAGGGAVIGDQQAKKKQQYAEREDALNIAIQQAQEATRLARVANEGLQREIVVLDDAVRRLRGQHMDAQRRTELARASRQRLEQSNTQAERQLVAVSEAIGRQQRALQRDVELARAVPDAPPPPALRLVRAAVDDLRSQERALESAKAQLALLDSNRAF